MKIHRIEHVGVIVNDLLPTRSFLDLGLEAQGEEQTGGERAGGEDFGASGGNQIIYV